MSGALNSVFGGGNIFGSLLSIAGMFFPPLAIASSLSNMLTQAIGQAVKGAVTQLIQEFGAPKFLQGIANAIIDQVVGGQRQQSDANVDAFTNEKFGKEVNDWTEQLTKDLVAQTKDRIQSNAKKSGGKASGGSWLEALARALGEVAGDKAARMVELSDKLTDLSKSDKKEDAKEMTAVSQELSGVSKMFQLLQDAANTTIKGIGDGLATAARKA